MRWDRQDRRQRAIWTRHSTDRLGRVQRSGCPASAAHPGRRRPRRCCRRAAAAGVRRRGPGGAAAYCGAGTAVPRRARRCTARRRMPAPSPVIRCRQTSKAPSVWADEFGGAIGSEVISATSSTSPNRAICCVECSRAIICWVVIASKWLRRKPSRPSATGPTAIRTSGADPVARIRPPSPRSTSGVPAAHTHLVAVLASTLNGRGSPQVGRMPRRPDPVRTSPCRVLAPDHRRRYGCRSAHGRADPRRAARGSGAPSSRSATVSRRSAWVPRVELVAFRVRSGRRCRPAWRSTNALMDCEHTSSISCSSAGSEVSANAISMRRRHATPSPTR